MYIVLCYFLKILFFFFFAGSDSESSSPMLKLRLHKARKNQSLSGVFLLREITDGSVRGSEGWKSTVLKYKVCSLKEYKSIKTSVFMFSKHDLVYSTKFLRVKNNTVHWSYVDYVSVDNQSRVCRERFSLSSVL